MIKIADGKLKIVVCPVCCDERGKIESVINRLKSMKQRNPEYHVMIIDDGSQDGSEENICAFRWIRKSPVCSKTDKWDARACT